jgi:hypothetical protein
MEFGYSLGYGQQKAQDNHRRPAYQTTSVFKLGSASGSSDAAQPQKPMSPSDEAFEEGEIDRMAPIGIAPKLPHGKKAESSLMAECLCGDTLRLFAAGWGKLQS